MTEFKNTPQQYLLSNPTKSSNQISQIIPLTPNQQLTIGRSHQNSLQILDNTISKKHSKIVNLKGYYYVYDLQSANGVLLNGQKVENQCKLDDGDCLQFGKYQMLYKFVDNTTRSKSRGKGKINLKDYLFQDNAIPTNNKQKITNKSKDILQGQQSVMTQPITQSRIPTQPASKVKKVRPKQSKIKIPDLSDYLKIANADNQQSQRQARSNENKSSRQKYTRSKEGVIPKQGRIKLQSLQQQIPTDQQLKQFKLDKRQRNIYIQQQQALQNLQKQRRKVQQQKLKKQLQQAKLAQDLLQKQLLLEQKVRQQQQKVQKQKLKLQQQFVKREQLKRDQQLQRIKNMEQKQKQMMLKIQQQRNKQLQQLKNKQQLIKQQSENQYKKQYDKRKKQLQIQAQALAKQYENIYRQTIKKVRTQIDNQQSTINKMENKQHQLTQQSQDLSDDIQKLEQQINKMKNQFLLISGRNKACILYASEIQDKIDSLGIKQFRQNQQGYYTNLGNNGINANKANAATRKIQQAIVNSRKLLKIKVKQYENILQQIASLSVTLKQRQFASSDVSDFVDTIYQNLQIIQKLKQEYLELVQCEKTVQEIWDAQIQQNNELQNKNRVLQSQITKNIREIDQNSRDQIKKSTEQRLHMLKVMHLCPQQKKSAAKFLIQQMLNIEQQIHKFTMVNQQNHNKICKIIAKTQKMKRQNQYLSQILFSQDQNGHHFDNMKVVINNLMDKIGEERSIDNVGDSLQLAKQAMKYQLLVQNQIERKKNLRQNMRKISEMGLAPGQIKITDKNPLTFFGDLLTNKQIQLQKRKYTMNSLQNQANTIKSQIRLLEQKKSKISQALQKYKVQQINQARKYLGKNKI